MGEIKAHEFDANLNRIARQNSVFLIYGPDRGLVAERAAAVAAKTGIDLKDPFSLVRLDSQDLSSDAGRLMDESQSMGLFGGEKLIWLRVSGTEKPLIDSLGPLLASDIAGATILIEAGDLKKGTALRKLVEQAGNAVAVPCYADDARALSALLEQELAAGNLQISASARQRLLDALGGDRAASRNELRKLVLYCRGEKMIEEHHVIEIVGDASGISADDAVDAILAGDSDGFIHAVNKVIASKTSVFLVLQACLRQMQLLDLMRAEMDDRGQSLQQVMGTHGRGIHFRRKTTFENALKTWSAAAIASEMNRLQAAILQTRRQNPLEDSIATQTLLATTLQSRRR